MTVKNTVVTAVVRQFGRPRGLVGRLAGWQMAHRPSNRRRNAWVVSVLDPRPGDRVLEVGFGPGLAVAEMSDRVGPTGHVYGIDHSEVMHRQATQRCASAVRDGRVTLVHGSVDALPATLDGPFDAVVSVNSFAFWADSARRLEDLRRRLVPGGRIAIASQARHPGVTRNPERAGREISQLLEDAGFTRPRVESLDLDPPVVCVLAAADGTDDGGQRA
ncbi:MAG: methyltransferase domain-containing protein [Actinomycetota bacterium]|nr:methyltransferase domain-containing protein [Actinomycetota bacterium]